MLATLAATLLVAAAQNPPSTPAVQAPATPPPPLSRLRDIFPRRPFFGRRADGMEWSHDNRYLAFRWNPYDERRYPDLYLYDRQTGKVERLTSIDTFLPFDRGLRGVKERYAKELQEEKERDTWTDERFDQWQIEQRDRQRPANQRDYAGPGEIEWANTKHELLLTYRGDVFRWKIGDKAPRRIHKTSEGESSLKWAKDDSGFFFRRGNNVFRMNFGSEELIQLNPELPDGFTMGGYWLSPDERKLAISAFAPGGAPSRQVTFSTFRDRFSGVRTVGRSVAEDPFGGRSAVFVYDTAWETEENPKEEGRPWQVWRWDGGDEWLETGIHSEPWSPDSRRFVFTTWARDKRELNVQVADVAERKLTTVFKDTHNGEHTTPGSSDPFFTKDGERILIMLERSGYRHIWSINPLTEGATQITRGDFEVYPLRLTKDGKSLVVQSSKEHPARPNLYLADLTSGEMRRITTGTGNYDDSPTVSEDGSAIAVNFRSWESPRELWVLDAKPEAGQKKLTDSHPGTFDRVNLVRPQLISYKNRHGHTVYAMIHLPPGWKKTDKRPLLVYTYGGPLGRGKSVNDGDFGSSTYTFPMFLAHRYGFVGVTVDPRGSSGYGGVFGAANWERPGVPQTEDLEDLVKFLVAEKGVDPARTALHGWSFGGWQTQHTMYTSPGTFTLGLAGAGPTQWQNYNNWYSGGVIANTPPGQPQVTDRFSLTKVAKNLRDPLLLIHGMEDDNVLYQDTVLVYRELLKARKGPLVELVLDPTGGHGLGGDIDGRQQMEIYLAFILRRWGIQP